MRLLKEDGASRVNATGQQTSGHVQDVVSQYLRVLRLGDGMKVYDAVHDCAVLVLQGHPVL